MGIQAELFEGSHGKLQFEQKPLEFTLTKSDLERIKHVPTSQLNDLGFADANDLLDTFNLKQINSGQFLGKVEKVETNIQAVTRQAIPAMTGCPTRKIFSICQMRRRKH